MSKCEFCSDYRKESIFPIRIILKEWVFGNDRAYLSLRLNGETKEHSIYFYSNVDKEITNLSMEINNCPMCGRKLTKDN